MALSERQLQVLDVHRARLSARARASRSSPPGGLRSPFSRGQVLDGHRGPGPGRLVPPSRPGLKKLPLGPSISRGPRPQSSPLGAFDLRGPGPQKAPPGAFDLQGARATVFAGSIRRSRRGPFGWAWKAPRRMAVEALPDRPAGRRPIWWVVGQGQGLKELPPGGLRSPGPPVQRVRLW